MSRIGYVMTTYFAVMLIGVLSIISFAPKLIWNASASTPIGLYAISASDGLEATDLVAVAAPEPIATFLADGGYLPRGVPLLKRVAGLPGALVCRSGVFVTVDGVAAARALARDRAGRPLPVWTGCRIVGGDELFLVNAARDSLDGRYFGAMPAAGLLGTAHPILTRSHPTAALRWGSAEPDHPPSRSKETSS